MNRKYLALALQTLSWAVWGLSLVAIVQFIRGELPNPIFLVIDPWQATTPLQQSTKWIFDIFGWLAGLGCYTSAGLAIPLLLNQLSTLVKLGWTAFREQQRTAQAEYDRWASVEHARAERRRIRERARAKANPSSVGAVLFGIVVGWLFFH